ncbi:MAG: hypothetical protein J0M08_01330 [Bacteroidetes bacterium]|nr:hypothetical protein [Bacteroidota bacterium]
MRLLISVFILLFFFSCKNEVSKNVEISTDSSKVFQANRNALAINIDAPLNQLAAAVAGIDSITYTLSQFNQLKNEQWYTYANKMNASWLRYDSLHTLPMTLWRNKELVYDSTHFLFYPFAGADILNAYTLFPDADKYILIGLEPIGSLPDTSVFSNASKFNAYTSAVNASLYAILNFSFFRTISMASDFHQKELNGTVHLLVLFLKRMNLQLVSFNYVAIDANGNEKSFLDYTSLQLDSALNKGCVIKFTDGKEIKQVYYFSVDLSDDKLNRNQGLFTYLAKEGSFNTYLKSASYLMHKTYFSKIRNFILANTSQIVQDDSGIPYRFIDSTKWDVQLYGTYSGPIPMFGGSYQPDFVAAYKAKASLVKPLPFGIGYKYKLGESNLQVIRTKQ